MTDANVLLAGNAFPRWPYEVLQHATDGDFRLVLCPLIIKQAREHLKERFPAHLGRFEKFLREVDYELVSDPTQQQIDANQNLVRDLSDVAIALAAIAARVDYLISEDKDFTVRDETTAELRRHLQVLLLRRADPSPDTFAEFTLSGANVFSAWFTPSPLFLRINSVKVLRSANAARRKSSLQLRSGQALRLR